jgi:outer membrane cobalamin receptor
LALMATLLRVSSAWAQIQHASIRIEVRDSRNHPVQGAVAHIENDSASFALESQTDEGGKATFENLPLGSFALKVSAQGFAAVSLPLNVRSNLPQQIDVALSIAPRTSVVNVTDTALTVEPDAASSTLMLGHEAMDRTPDGVRTRQMQTLVAQAPGITVQKDGLLNVRGVEDGILYVVDGIPAGDRVDAVNGAAIDPESVQSVKIFTGNIPAEFGGRSGAVVELESKSGISRPVSGGLSYETGSYGTAEASGDVSGGGKVWGLFSSFTASRSERYLDPPSLQNFDNEGKRAGGSLRGEWRPSLKDTFILNLNGAATDFRIPNDPQQEAAGQRASQELHNSTQSLNWQHVWSASTVSNLAVYRNYYRSQLYRSAGDVPISASQDRHHAREGLLFNVSHSLHGHTLQAGVESSEVHIVEGFNFFVTDPQLALQREITDAALQFTASAPFVFRGSLTRPQNSGYVEDTFQVGHNLSVSAGLRYDRSSLVVADSQWSPRLGVAYQIRSTGTTLRASFNRLFMPPQVENLLLSNSAEARALSPFVTLNGGGVDVAPERTSAYEAGVVQSLKRARLEIAPWLRHFENFTDANVFFNTTIIFPNSVASADARGIDVRLDLLPIHGWSGFVNYTNSRITAVGPINGGLFLTSDFTDIGPGSRYTPDHDQRNVGSSGISYEQPKARDLRCSFMTRYQSGAPLNADPGDLARLEALPGSYLVDFNRQRLKPWIVSDATTSFDLLDSKSVNARLRADVENLFNREYAFEFGDPFEGTHFGTPRIWKVGLEVRFKGKR